MSTGYKPPYSLTPQMMSAVAEIAEMVGRYTERAESVFTPTLRRGNRIRTVQASLAIENNTLTVDQVTAVLEGKRVLGLPREIQEVRNAFSAYDKLDSWDPSSKKDLLDAHGLMTAGLIDDAGTYRSGNVGIYQGKQLIHMAPPADRVHFLMDDLLSWLRETPEHPIIASCIFHYEFEFIHPFSDGNGRLGRLWQTLILSKWKPLWAFLPVETIVAERQEQYYALLGKADAEGDATSFVEFMILIIKDALLSTLTMEVSMDVTMEVKKLLRVIHGEMKRKEIQNAMGLKNDDHFRLAYLAPALADGLIEMTQPDSPKSPTQRYRLTEKGRKARGL